MSTPLPTDPAFLPPHQALPLTAKQRQGLAPVAWEAEVHRFTDQTVTIWRGKSPEGTWSVIGKGERQDELRYEISFFPNVSEETYQEARAAMKAHDNAGTVEWQQAFGKTHPCEFGYTSTEALAKALVDRMRHQEPGLDVQAALAAAGFEEEPSSKIDGGSAQPNRWYVKKIDRNRLTLRVGPYGCKLEFQRRNSHRWENLYHLSVARATHDGRAALLVWPSVVAEPASVALMGALAAAAAFEEKEAARRLDRQAKKAAKSSLSF